MSGAATLGTSSQSMRDMWRQWEAEVMRLNVNASTGPIRSVLNHGVWPKRFFESPVFYVWISGAYVAMMVLWLLYRDRSRRQNRVMRMGWFRVAWNAAWLAFSGFSVYHFVPVLLRRWYLLPDSKGWYDGICVSLDIVLLEHRRDMLLLFFFVALRPLKLYEVLFAEAKGTTEAKRLLAYHLGAPALCWLLATQTHNTTVMLAWAALVAASDVVLHGYFAFKDVMNHFGLRATPLLKVLVAPSQAWYCWGGFFMAAIGSDCDGNFTGPPRMVFLVASAAFSALAVRDMNERIFPQSFPEEEKVSDAKLAASKRRTRKKVKRK